MVVARSANMRRSERGSLDPLSVEANFLKFRSLRLQRKRTDERVTVTDFEIIPEKARCQRNLQYIFSPAVRE